MMTQAMRKALTPVKRQDLHNTCPAGHPQGYPTAVKKGFDCYLQYTVPTSNDEHRMVLATTTKTDETIPRPLKKRSHTVRINFLHLLRLAGCPAVHP